jgi:hypothetical protein
MVASLGSGPGGVLGRCREQNGCGCMRMRFLGRCRSLGKQLFRTDWQSARAAAGVILSDRGIDAALETANIWLKVPGRMASPQEQGGG